MKTVIFNSGVKVEPRDLMSLELYLQEEIKDRELDFISPGIVGPEVSYVFKDVGGTLRFEPFRALNRNGEVIQLVKPANRLALNLVDTTDNRLTTQGALSPSEWGFEDGITYYICARYITKYGRPRPHVVSNQGYATRLYPGVELWALKDTDSMVVDGVNPFIILASYTYNATNPDKSILVTDGVTQYARIDPAKMTAGGPTAPVTTNYNPRNLAVSFLEHIMALGPATPTPDNPHGMDLSVTLDDLTRHETYMHSPGFIGDVTSVNSLGYMLVNVVTSGQDNIKVFNLKSANNEYIVADGNWSTKFNFDQDFAFIQMQVRNGTTYEYAPSGVYKFGVNYKTSQIVVAYSGSETAPTALILTDKSALAIENEIGTIPVYTLAQYDQLPILDLCQFTFEQYSNTQNYVKPLSSVTPAYARSNFTEKTDLRKVGTIAPENLQATKNGETTVIPMPYSIQVPSILFTSGAVFDGAIACPTDYISGFTVSRDLDNDNVITITKGICKDMDNIRDIVLSKSITKYIDRVWSFGGDTVNPGGAACADVSTATTLHVFAIMTSAGLVDIAVDTSVTGHNILYGGVVSNYTYIRRICSLYRVPHTEGSTTVYTLQPFTSRDEKGVLYIEYNTPIALPTSAISGSTSHSLSMYIPSDKAFTATLNYIDAASTITLSPNDSLSKQQKLSGSGVTNITTTDGKAYVVENSVPTIKVLGYKDGR